MTKGVIPLLETALTHSPGWKPQAGGNGEVVGWVSAIDVIADYLGVERLHIGRCQDKVDLITRAISLEAVKGPDIVCIRMQCPKCIDHRGGIFNIGVVLAGHSGLALQE